MIIGRNIKKSFEDGAKVLEDISFTVEDGDIYGW